MLTIELRESSKELRECCQGRRPREGSWSIPWGVRDARSSAVVLAAKIRNSAPTSCSSRVATDRDQAGRTDVATMVTPCVTDGQARPDRDGRTAQRETEAGVET